MTPRSNSPESEALTLGETEVFEQARLEIPHFRKTFDSWVKMGMAVITARDITDRRGGPVKMIRQIIEQQGSVIVGPDVSRLLRIMPKIEEVKRWRATLTEHQQIAWSSPTTIL